MHIVALVQGRDHVCCRYRLDAFLPIFENAGHVLEFIPFPRRVWSWVGIGRMLRRADAVILQRRLLHPWLLYFLRRQCQRLIFDFDDAVFLRDSFAARGPRDRRRRNRFAATIHDADVVIAGNDYLREQARSCAGATQIHVIPTCVDTDSYHPAEHSRAGAGVELVWVGSASTLQGLEAARPLLESLGRSSPGLHLKLVCDRFMTLDHLPVIACPWVEGIEPEALATADIGISHVPDDLWSRGKCGLKLLHYMAAGLPVVANPVGVQAEMVRHGETGFLARTPDEWQEAIALLTHNPELRRRMGRAGRQLVEKEYSLRAGGARWLSMLREMEPATMARTA